MVIKVLLALLFPLILTMLLEKRRPKGIIWGKDGYIIIGDYHIGEAKQFRDKWECDLMKTFGVPPKYWYNSYWGRYS